MDLICVWIGVVAAAAAAGAGDGDCYRGCAEKMDQEGSLGLFNKKGNSDRVPVKPER